MGAEPRLEVVEAKLLSLIQSEQEAVGGEVIEFETKAVHAQEGGSHSDRDSLVAVDERMILRKAFEQRRGLLDDILIVAALWSCQRRLQCRAITQAGRAAKDGEQAFVCGENLLDRRVEGH